MYTRTLSKPDGRSLRLYSRRPIPETISSPPTAPQGAGANSYLRWHPLLREWVDDPAARPEDLDALASADEQAWFEESKPLLLY